MIKVDVQMSRCVIGTNIKVLLAGLCQHDQASLSENLFPIFVAGDKTFSYSNGADGTIAFAFELSTPFPDAVRDYGTLAAIESAGVPEWVTVTSHSSVENQIELTLHLESFRRFAEYVAAYEIANS